MIESFNNLTSGYDWLRKLAAELKPDAKVAGFHRLYEKVNSTDSLETRLLLRDRSSEHIVMTPALARYYGNGGRRVYHPKLQGC